MERQSQPLAAENTEGKESSKESTEESNKESNKEAQTSTSSSSTSSSTFQQKPDLTETDEIFSELVKHFNNPDLADMHQDYYKSIEEFALELDHTEAMELVARLSLVNIFKRKKKKKKQI